MKQTKVLKRPKMSEYMKGKQRRLGKKMSEEAKKARREQRGPTNYARRRIPVIDLDTKTSYPSILHASNALGISTASIYRSLNNLSGFRKARQFIRLDEKCATGF